MFVCNRALVCACACAENKNIVLPYLFSFFFCSAADALSLLSYWACAPSGYLSSLCRLTVDECGFALLLFVSLTVSLLKRPGKHYKRPSKLQQKERKKNNESFKGGGCNCGFVVVLDGAVFFYTSAATRRRAEPFRRKKGNPVELLSVFHGSLRVYLSAQAEVERQYEKWKRKTVDVSTRITMMALSLSEVFFFCPFLLTVKHLHFPPHFLLRSFFLLAARALLSLSHY